jgi:hypothetical protein
MVHETAAQAALIQHLIKTVVEPEVTRPMESIGWGHGTPPAPIYTEDNPQGGGNTTPLPAPVPAAPGGGQPAPAAAPVAPVAGEPKPDASSDPLSFLEELKDPKTGLYAGKYPSRAELLKGMGHVVQMAKGAYTKADLAEQEAARLRDENARLRLTPAAPAAVPQPAPGSGSQPTPARSAKLDAVLSKLKEEGGILDEENVQALVQGVSELAETRAAQIADERLNSRETAARAENAKWMGVDEHMRKVAPESLAYADEIGLHVKSDPLAAAAVGALVRSGNLNEAAELSWRLFHAAHGSATPSAVTAATTQKSIELEAGDQVRREALDRARKDAGVSSSAATGVHTTPGAVGPTQEEIDQAAMEMHSGDGIRWRALTIGRSLTDPIFG